jgi:hypothetical protein
VRGDADVRLVDLESDAVQTDDNAQLFTTGLMRTVTALSEIGRRAVVVSQVPEVGYDVSAALVVARRTGRDINELIAPTMDDYTVRNQTVLSIFRSLEESGRVRLVSPAPSLCETGRCLVATQSGALYRDSHHLSTYGAHYIASVFNGLFPGRESASAPKSSPLNP